MDFAVWRNFFEQGVLVDLPVNGDRYALFEVGLHRRISLAELPEEVPDRAHLKLELRLPLGKAAKRSGQHDPGHLLRYLPRASSSAFKTLGGDIGSSVKRMPVACSIALAMAAIGGTIGVSPTPRTP